MALTEADYEVAPESTSTVKLFAPVELAKSETLFLTLDAKGHNFVARIACVKDGQEVSWPAPSWSARSVLDRLPERNWLGSKNPDKRFQWEFPATDVGALVVHQLWPREQLHFGRDLGRHSSDAETTFKYLVARFAQQKERAVAVAEFKEKGVVPAPPRYWVDHPTLPLTDYQRASAILGLGHEAFALFQDPGVGKTAPCIQRMCVEAMAEWPKTRKMFRTLIVCPPQVRGNWKREIERFAVTQGKVTVVRGGKLKRIKQLVHGITSEPDCVFTAVIVSYDSLASESTLEAFCRVPWNLVVCDESHLFKSSSTQRWKTMRAIRECSERRMILTGTPIGNSPMDLWTQLEFLGHGLSGFSHYRTFKNFHGVHSDAGASGVSKLVGIKNIPLLQERLARLSFSLTKAEAGLKLPDKVYDTREVEMTKQQAEIYGRVANEIAVEIEDALSGDTNALTINNILTMLLRLAQIANGHVVWDARVDIQAMVELAPKRVELFDPNPKVQALVEDVQEDLALDPTGKTLVWCVFRPDVAAITKALAEAGVKYVELHGGVPQDQREAIERAYNYDPDVKVCVANPTVAGAGLNLVGYDYDRPGGAILSTDTTNIAMFSCNWSSIDRRQAEDRGHRKGTRRGVRVRDYIVPGTIDEEIRDRVQYKKDMAMSVLDVRNILERLVQ